jgi:hypothetical protein
MKKTILFSALTMFSFFLSAQTDEECDDTKKYVNGEYVGCLNYQEERVGFGVYSWDDGSSYSGQWKKDEKDGQGVYTFSSGGSYDGEWKENERDGRGVLRNDKNKVVYDGQWKKDEKDGQGVYTFSSGDSYDGEWKENEKDGKGTSYLKDGEIIKQVYNKGELELFSEKSNIRNYNVKKDIEGSEEGSIDVSLEKEENSFMVGLTFGKKGGSFTENYSATFDTGAAMFSIGYRLFRELKRGGLDYDDLKITKNAVGVSGVPLPNMLIKIKTLKIGEYEVKNVVAWVETSEKANSSLLGIGFFNKFSEVKWSLKQKNLELFR